MREIVGCCCCWRIKKETTWCVKENKVSASVKTEKSLDEKVIRSRGVLLCKFYRVLFFPSFQGSERIVFKEVVGSLNLCTLLKGIHCKLTIEEDKLPVLLYHPSQDRKSGIKTERQIGWSVQSGL